MLSPPVKWVASFLVFIMEEQHLEKIRVNLRLELHTPPCPLQLMAGKWLLFLENFKRDCYLYTSSISSVCTLPTHNPSTLGPSSVERTTLA